MITEFKIPKILVISYGDGGGGAEICGYHLFMRMIQKGLNGTMYVGRIKQSNDNLVKFLSSEIKIINMVTGSLPLSNKIKEKIRYLFIFLVNPKIFLEWFTGKEYTTIHSTKKKLKKILEEEKPDIVHCHNLHGHYFDLSVLSWLSNQIPTLITLHDAWLLTGYCSHYLDCLGWKYGCVNCKNLPKLPPISKNIPKINWSNKKNVYSNSKLYVVGPSKWIVDVANKSILNRGIVEAQVIPNGIDLSIFHPGDKISARDKLKLPKDTFIIIFSASGLKQNQYKDFKTLQRTLEILGKSDEQILCLALGDSGEAIHIGNGVDLCFIPFISDRNTIAEYYRASDVYVHPTKADTFPTSIIEAEACGIPVVASRVCGIPEQIEERKTGFLISVGDAETMAERILLLKREYKLRAEMGACATELAKKRYSDEAMVKDYLSLYLKLCGR